MNTICIMQKKVCIILKSPSVNKHNSGTHNNYKKYTTTARTAHKNQAGSNYEYYQAIQDAEKRRCTT